MEQPFEKIRKNYQWWMIDDINFDVNEIYKNIGKDSLLRHYISMNNFILYNNPYALNAIYQYGYYLIGIYHNAQYEIESIVYAIPSRYGVEPHPLLGVQAYARWIPKNGHKVMLGSMGYWVIRIDVKNADIAIMH